MNRAEQGHLYRWEGQEEPRLAELVAALRQAGWLPTGESWCFAWHELDIQLPQRLRDPDRLPNGWDVLRIFAPRIEYRQVRQGGVCRHSLLTEEAELPATLTGWHLDQVYTIVPSLRILWGNRLRLPGREGRGVVTFPRELTYDVAGEHAHYDEAVVADVALYYDDEARLRTVRYLRLRHLTPGADSANVLPYACNIDEPSRNFGSIPPLP